MTLRMCSFCVVALVAAYGSLAHGQEPVKLLCGFEEADAAKWGAKRDGDALRWQVSYYKAVWFRKGDATQGEWALVVGVPAIRRGTHYNVLRRRAVLNSYPWFRKRFPADWSGYDRLRLDVQSGAAGRLRIDLEDELCQPQARRTFAVPKGQWVTLEFPLAEAAKLHTIPLPKDEAERLGVPALEARRLNLAKMANLEIYFEALAAKCEVRLDNLRLLAPDCKRKPKHRIVRDTSPFLVPQALPLTEPTPPATPKGFTPVATLPKAPTPRPVDLSNVGKTCYARLGNTTARAFVAADTRRLLLGFNAGYMHVFQTKDGGATWLGLDGKPTPTRCYHNANAPSHCAAAAGLDLLYAYTDHCAGGGNPSNLFFRLLRFNGTGWILEPPRLLDVDCRHCPEFKVRLLRLKSGRIWAAWMHLSRLGKHGVRARYSDDAGVTWRDPDSNALVIINRDQSQGPQRYGVTLWVEQPKGLTPPADQANGRLGPMYAHGGLQLTPHGDNVACIWAQSWYPNAVWSMFDGKTWGKPRPIGRGSPVSAVTVGKATIYLSLSYKRATRILRLSGEKWVEDMPPMGQGGVLCASGDTVCNFWTKKEGKKAALYESHKRAGGEWTPPRRLALETVPGAGRRARLGITVPQYAPEAFVPVAWGPHDAWIKTMLLPNPVPDR